MTGREPCCPEVVPGIWVGRRAYARELPPDITLVVDLTAEFPEPRAVRAGRSYVCLPTLDATAPDAAVLKAWCGGWTNTGGAATCTAPPATGLPRRSRLLSSWPVGWRRSSAG